jgi:non-heme chloroperoxidase
MPEFTTLDACTLNYVDQGSGKPLVLLHGWSQSSAMFKHQIHCLSERYRVVALDLRGHGESEKPESGYRIARFAKDVYELFDVLDLQEVNFLGWSMGCSVIWSYFELFGSERLSKLILVDEPPWVLNTEDYDMGSFAIDELWPLCTKIRDTREEITRSFVDRMVTTDLPKMEKEWIVQENLKTPAHIAARLIFTHASTDWRDLIPRIDLPTLVVGAKKSIVPWKSQIWLHEQIPGSKVEIFETYGHIMFYESFDRFNQIVTDFVE